MYRCAATGRELSAWEARCAGVDASGAYEPAAAAAAADSDTKVARGLLRTLRARAAAMLPTSDSEPPPEGAEGADAGVARRKAAALRFSWARRAVWGKAEATLDAYRIAAKRAAAVQVSSRTPMK